MSRVGFTVAVVAITAASAGAEPVATVIEPHPEDVPAPPPPPAPDREPCAADVANAPLPGHESGRLDPVDDGDTTARKIGRDALFLPKLLTNIVLAPARGSVWAYDRFHLDELYYRVFFNDERTIGLYPTFAYESGYGFNGVTGGARFVARDLFGEREHLALQAAAGVAYEFRQLYSANFRTGDRLGQRFSLELDAGYEIRPRDGFYGIGNAMGEETRYSQDRARGLVTGDLRLFSDLHLRPAASLAKRTFGDPSSGTPTDEVYMPVGWKGTESAYGELELRWDGRHALGEWDPRGSYTSGTLAAAFAGRSHRLDEGNDYWRYGFDLQQFVRLGRGPRVLSARIHGEAVSGSVFEVPFSELPSLGGPLYLRGYALDQFRDRVAAFGTLEYSWDLSGWIDANVFVDGGRVFPSLTQLATDHLRAGYGFGLVLQHGGGFISEVSVASSIDGGWFFNLAFNPIYDLDQRVRRR